MLVALLIHLQNLAPFSALRASGYVYPTVLALHLSFISLFGAMIVATDLRLLEWALSKSSISDLIAQLRWPKRIGFLLAGTCGFLLFSCKAEEYYYNPAFRLKMLLFLLVAVHALVFRQALYSDAANLGTTAPASAKSAGAISLILWLGILCAGRGIGYVTVGPGMHYR
jgi:uncharacterized membrane protein